MWFENPAWQHNGFLGFELVKALFDGAELQQRAIKRLKTYILAYACHIAIMQWVFNPDDLEKGKYLGAMEAPLQDLREIHRLTPHIPEHITQMIQICLDVAIDPF